MFYIISVKCGVLPCLALVVFLSVLAGAIVAAWIFRISSLREAVKVLVLGTFLGVAAGSCFLFVSSQFGVLGLIEYRVAGLLMLPSSCEILDIRRVKVQDT